MTSGNPTNIIQNHCLDYCTRRGLLPVHFHVPETDGGNIAPTTPGTRSIAIIAWGGHRGLFGLRMGMAAWRRGIRRIVHSTPTGWTDQNLLVFNLLRLLEKISPVLPPPSIRTTCRRLCKNRRSLFSPIPERIAVFANSLAGGGAERQMVNTIIGLTRRGFPDIHLLCTHIENRPGHDFYRPLLQQKEIGASEIPSFTSPRNAAQPSLEGETAQNLLSLDENFGKILRRLPPELSCPMIGCAMEILRLKPSIVHAWQDSSSVAAGFAAAMLGVPRIILGGRTLAPCHYPASRPWLRDCYRELARHPDVVMLNNSIAGARSYEKWLGLPEGHIRILFNGFDAEKFSRADAGSVAAFRKRLGIPEGDAIIGTIARMSEEKDPFLFFETANLLLAQHPRLSAIHVGSGPMEDELRNRVRSAGLENRFFMPGQMADAALALSSMDVFLLTSRIEGTPNVSLEAGWLGVPVVATDAGGTKDTFDNGKTGFLVGSRDASALAEKVSFILANPVWKKQAAENAPAFVQARFGVERMISETLDAYGISPP